MTHLNAVATLIVVYVSIAELLGVPLDPECEKTKGCFHDCIDETFCEFLVSWMDTGDTVTYTLASGSERNNTWMAIAFSDDKFMGNDSVTGCKYLNGNPEIFNAKNSIPRGNKSKPEILGNEGVILVNASKISSVFTCTFERVKAAGINIDRFSLNQPWYLFFAKGNLNDTGELQSHKSDKYPSDVKYDPAFRPPVTTPAATTTETTTAAVTTEPPTPPPVVTTEPPTSPPVVTTEPPTSPAVVTTIPPTSPPVVTTEPPTPPPVVTTEPPTSPAVVTTVPPTPAQVTTPQPSSPTIDKVKGCGRTHGCFSDCVRTHCGFIISWHIEGNDAIYTVSSKVARGSAAWVAVGFSSDKYMVETTLTCSKVSQTREAEKDENKEDDDVMGCLADTTGRIIAFTGWNTKYSSPDMYTDNEIKLTDTTTNDGLLSCTFRRPIAGAPSGKLAALSASRRVNVNEPWILLFAKGLGRINSIQGNGFYLPYTRVETPHVTAGNGPLLFAVKDSEEFHISYHESNRFIATRPVSASDKIDLGSIYDEYPLIKAHGSLMIIAWILMSGIGTVIARYYKSLSGSKIFFKYSWLQAHRMYMIIVLSATVTGTISIYVHVKGYSAITGDQTFLKSHPLIGIITIILTVLNLVMALFRPEPGTSKRLIFKWAHRIVGTSAQILAVINIFFGVQMEKSDVPYYLVYILAGYTVWQVTVGIVLEVVSFFGHKSNNVQVSETSETAPLEGSPVVESPTSMSAKRIIFGVHCAVLFSFATSLIVLLVLGNKNLEA